jgi:hypothetical protein
MNSVQVSPLSPSPSRRVVVAARIAVEGVRNRGVTVEYEQNYSDQSFDGNGCQPR